MPLWLIYHPEGTFPTSTSKQSLADTITSFYTSFAHLPAFYVVVNFISLPASNIFVGGKNPAASRPFIRFTVDHVAIRQPNEGRMTAMADKIAELLRPHLEGCDWEWNIDETPRALWRLNGIDPPPSECLPSS